MKSYHGVPMGARANVQIPIWYSNMYPFFGVRAILQSSNLKCGAHFFSSSFSRCLDPLDYPVARILLGVASRYYRFKDMNDRETLEDRVRRHPIWLDMPYWEEGEKTYVVLVHLSLCICPRVSRVFCCVFVVVVVLLSLCLEPLGVNQHTCFATVYTQTCCFCFTPSHSLFRRH